MDALLAGIAMSAALGAVPVSASTPASSSSELKLDSALSGESRRHDVYFEALGKGGLWGVGYDYALLDQLSIGTAGSFYYLDGQRYLTLSPYLTYYPVSGAHSRWLVQAGPQIVNQAIISQVPEWDGMQSTSLNGMVATGYEYRNRFLFRAYAMLTMGGKGVEPWLGFGVGWTF